MRGATGHQREPVETCKIQLLGQIQCISLHIMAQRIAQNGGLFSDLLGHEMLVAGLFDLYLTQVDPYRLAVCMQAAAVKNFGPGTRYEGIITLFKLGDTVGHRRQRDRI